jgi:hypothetical protein
MRLFQNPVGFEKADDVLIKGSPGFLVYGKG